MRPNSHFVFVLLLLSIFATVALFAAETVKIATIDLSMAASLHPRMALFDFDRMGFFKVAPGLSQEAFQEAILALKTSSETIQLSELRLEIEQKLSVIERQRATLLVKLSEPQQSDIASLTVEIDKVAVEEQLLRDQLSDISYAAACPDLTNPATTREILNQIESEILAKVNAIASKDGYVLVLNTTIPVPYGYPVRYQSGETYGQGVPGINFSLFYAFLAKNNLIHPSDETPPSRELINWLELTKFPEAVNLLPMRPYPLVLSGGHSILSEVIQQIYADHQIDPEVFKVVDSVIHKIEQQHSAGRAPVK